MEKLLESRKCSCKDQLAREEWDYPVSDVTTGHVISAQCRFGCPLKGLIGVGWRAKAVIPPR